MSAFFFESIVSALMVRGESSETVLLGGFWRCIEFLMAHFQTRCSWKFLISNLSKTFLACIFCCPSILTSVCFFFLFFWQTSGIFIAWFDLGFHHYSNDQMGIMERTIHHQTFFFLKKQTIKIIAVRFCGLSVILLPCITSSLGETFMDVTSKFVLHPQETKAIRIRCALYQSDSR